METQPSKVFIVPLMAALSFLFAVSCIIPVILPSILAYVFGCNSQRDKRRYGISLLHILIPAMIGELVFSALVGLLLNYSIGLQSHLEVFWYLIIIFSLNYLCSAIFYFLGTRQKIFTC